MKKTLLTIALLATLIGGQAQDRYRTTLESIEQNSTALKALAAQRDADIMGSRTGLTPSDPEVEVGYLWGSPRSIGNRVDVAVMQSFDFPSVYFFGSALAGLKGEGAELNYLVSRTEIMLQAKELCIETAYYNALVDTYTQRKANADKIAEAYEKSFSQGQCNAIERNKAQLNLTMATNELSRIKAERESKLSLLSTLNGGRQTEFTESEFPLSAIPKDFEQWYELSRSNSPILQYLAKRVEQDSVGVRLSRSQSLPRFSAGYMSEKVVGERYGGVKVGMSIPLWQSRNTVRHAKAQLSASQMALEQASTALKEKMRSAHQRATELKALAQQYGQSIDSFSNTELLNKALEAGQMSLLDYLRETEYIYSAIDQMLSAERDAALSEAELNALTL